MKKLRWFALSSVCWLAATECLAADSAPVEVIQLTNAKDIGEASSMSGAIDEMSKKVMECSQSKRAPASECFCLYPKELSHVRKI